MSLASEDLKRAMSNKTDEELHDILYAHSGDYTADAVEIAKEEFRCRKLDAPTLRSFGAAVEEQRRREEASLEWPLRIVAFFFSTLFFGIPVILAHRHFVEQGARHKAREWGRWGLFGFVFYFTLSVNHGGAAHPLQIVGPGGYRPGHCSSSQPDTSAPASPTRLFRTKLVPYN